MKNTLHNIAQINSTKNQTQRFKIILSIIKTQWENEYINTIIEELYYKEFNFIHDNNYLTENIIKIIQNIPQKEQEILIIELAKKAANTLGKENRESIIKTLNHTIQNRTFLHIESEAFNNYKTTSKTVENNSLIDSYLDAYYLLLSLDPHNKMFLRIIDNILNKTPPSKFSQFIDFILITIPNLPELIENNIHHINKSSPSLLKNSHFIFLKEYKTILKTKEINIDLFLDADPILIKKLPNDIIYNCLEKIFKNPTKQSIENRNIYLFSLHQNQQTYVFQQGLQLSGLHADLDSIEILKKLISNPKKDIRTKAAKAIENIFKRHKNQLIGSLELSEPTSLGGIELHDPGRISLID